jgi:hypothetical protein
MVDMGVLFVLLGPLYLRWPILLVPIIGAIGATVASAEWSRAIQPYTVPAIFITLFGYVLAVFAKMVGVTTD